MAKQPAKPASKTPAEIDDDNSGVPDLFERPTGPLDDGGVEVMADDGIKDGELKIQVVDPDEPPAEKPDEPDEPDEDQGQPQQPVGDPDDEELKQYSKKVRQRISELTYHREQAKRDAQAQAEQAAEATRIARMLHEENQKLRGLSGDAMKLLKNEAQTRAEAQVAAARQLMKEAFDAGDGEKIADAQQKLAAATYALENAKSWVPPDMQVQQPPQQAQPQPQQNMQQPMPQVPNDRDKQWLRENEWFTKNSNPVMSQYAKGVHFDLVMNGVPPGSEVYYRSIDAEMRKAFPDFFARGQSAATSRKAPVVAAAQRTAPSGQRTVQLTPTQVQVAKRLGVSLEDYARQYLKENGNVR